MELKDFFIGPGPNESALGAGGAFLGGSCLSDCCRKLRLLLGCSALGPSYTLVDDGSACGAAESVPLFREGLRNTPRP